MTQGRKLPPHLRQPKHALRASDDTLLQPLAILPKPNANPQELAILSSGYDAAWSPFGAETFDHHSANIIHALNTAQRNQNLKDSIALKWHALPCQTAHSDWADIAHAWLFHS